MVNTRPCQGRDVRVRFPSIPFYYMKYIVLFISLLLPVFLSAEKLKATGYVVVRIISQESLIDSNELMENKFPDNYQVYLYTMDNTINFIF